MARVESVTFEYDGADSIIATIEDAIPGQLYALYPDWGTEVQDTAVTDTLILTTDVGAGSLSPGQPWSVVVQDGPAFTVGSNFVATECFELGSIVPFDGGASWSFDGNDSVECTWVGEVGENYLLASLDPASGGNNVGPFAGAGATLVEVVGSFAPPYTGNYFLAYLLRGSPGSYDVIATRLFEEGVSGTGTNGQGEAIPAAPGRFYEAPPWRFLVTDLDSVSLTFLDKRCSDREVVKTLNAPMQIAGRVESDDPEIYLEYDGYPVLSEGLRLVYCFRREGNSSTPGADNWIIRAAGIILEVGDLGGPNVPDSRWRAYDPWQLLYRRPVRKANGDLPDEEGVPFTDNAGDIALTLVNRTIAEDGPLHLDVTSGTFEATESIEITFQQGTSVGEAWDALVATGTLDIVLTPIYRPIADPGIVSELSIYAEAGSVRREAVMAWDKPSRSLVNLDRAIDGKERVNRAQYYRGQGGPPVPLVSDTASISDFGEYWEQQFFPGMPTAAAVEAFAEAQVRLRERGLITYQLSPAPERSPSPFTDYDIGDYVPIYASQRLRQEVSALKRVQSIPLTIGNDQMEAIGNLLLTDDPDLSS